MFAGAENAALASAASSCCLVTPFSTPPVLFVVGSVEYFLTTVAQLWPELSAFLAAAAFAALVASTIFMFRVSCVPNCDRWLL